MTQYMNYMMNLENNNIYTNNLINKTYSWGNNHIYFLEDYKINAFGNSFGNGNYKFKNNYIVEANFGNKEHILKFNNDYTKFTSIRKGDFEVVNGYLYCKSTIPKKIMQTSQSKPDDYIIRKIKKRCLNWEYNHFTDNEILDFFTDYYIKLYSKIVSRVKVDYILIWEDMAFKNGPLVSPNIFKKFLLPFYKKFTFRMKEFNVEHFFVDTDGNFEVLIPLFVEGGVTGFTPFEVQSGLDIEKIREMKYNNIEFFAGDGFKRLRILDIDEKTKRILVLFVDHRKNVYKKW
jgi:hypothetical protein